MLRIKTLIIYLTLVLSAVMAQEAEPATSFEDYVKLYNEGWTIRPNAGMKNFTFSLVNTNSKQTIRYTPNVAGGIGCRFVYKAFGVGFTMAIPQPEDADKGKSTYLDWQFTFPLGKHGIDFTLQNYTGFYTQEKNGTYVRYPNLAGALIELRYYYAFNSEFSLKAAFNQTARQLQDAGSWIISTSLNAFVVSHGSNFIPASYALDFPELNFLDAMTYTGLSIGGGYAYTWVYSNNWFFTPAFIFELNSETQTYYILGGEYAQQVPGNPKTSLKLSAGRHLDKYYFGAMLVVSNTMAIASENIQFNASTFNINFYYGIRL